MARCLVGNCIASVAVAALLLAPGALLAQDEPLLPGESPPIGALHRDANGRIEVIDPTKDQGGGHACTAGTICVGKGQAYATLAAAVALARIGDTIEILGGTYHESITVTAKNLTIRGIAGRPHLDCAGVALAGDKGCVLLKADGVTLDNIEISGAVIADGLGGNGACIRNNGPDQSFTVRNIICHGSQEGILSDGGAAVIENSEFYDNGWSDSTHNVYLSGNCTATVRGSVFRDARVGHEFKSRCRKTEISDSTFRSTKGSRNLDIPDGGETMVYRSRLSKTPGAQNMEYIGFAAESCAHPGDMVLKDVHIENSMRDALIHNFDKCEGHPIVLQQVTVEGLPIKELGYILRR